MIPVPGMLVRALQLSLAHSCVFPALGNVCLIIWSDYFYTSAYKHDVVKMGTYYPNLVFCVIRITIILCYS